MKKILKLTISILLITILSFLSCKKEHSCENCGTNKPPIANAGSDQLITLPTDSVSLNGRISSDPDGKISEWLWTKISGPASFNIIKPTDSTTKVKVLVTGTYQFELKVTDNGGLSAKDTLQIIVNDPSQPNQPPVANAGADQTITLPTNTITLDGSASTDPDNNITSYAWTKISGPSSFNIGNASTVQTQVANLMQGTYQFELKVTDAGGLFSKDTVQIIINTTILPNGQLPTANAGPDVIITLPLDSVYLSGTSSVFPVVFQWIKIFGPAGSSITNSDTYALTALIKGLIPGLYSFRLEVSNGAGIYADTMNVLVIDDPQDFNTITFKNLKWRLVDEYGTGIIDLNIETPSQPNLFIAWDQTRPIEVYLRTDSISQFFIVPSVQSGFLYAYDAARPVIWIARIPRDDTWVGKESSIKIKLL